MCNHVRHNVTHSHTRTHARTHAQPRAMSRLYWDSSHVFSTATRTRRIEVQNNGKMQVTRHTYNRIILIIVLIISSKHGNVSKEYFMGNTILGTSVKEKDYLGVTVSADMTVSEQCGLAAAKGNQIVGLIRRNITYTDTTLIMPLYMATLRILHSGMEKER